MQYFAPPYYRQFWCVADRCRHSCCVGWEIGIDEEKLAAYRAMTGEVGALVNAAILEDEAGARFALAEDGRCALLDARGLCRLICAAGEEALCEICREHPRFYNRIADRLECGLGAACEEAARLILAEARYADVDALDACDDEIAAATGSDFDVFSQRAALYAVLSDHARPYEERLREIVERFGVPTDGVDTKALCAELEYLYEAHRALFDPSGAPLVLSGEQAVVCERFFAYLIYRHASVAENAEDFALSVGVALILEGLLRHLLLRHGLAPIEAVRILSEELEYCEENLDLIRFALQQSLL